MKIAVIGSGISGMVAAYYAGKNDDWQVDLFEARDRLGGHTATVDIQMDGKNLAVDTGFIVFNNKTYPNFLAFLNELGVEKQNTEMSFSVFDKKNNFEYNGNNLSSLFSQRKNIFSPKFYGFIYEILRFNNLCKEINQRGDKELFLTFGEFLKKYNFSEHFQQYYILPMASAIWSSSYSDIKKFSLQFFVRFFENHGLLNVVDRPQWYVIKKGSKSYIDALLPKLKANIKLNTPVLRITRKDSSVSISTKNGTEEYDQVIFACHSDQALKILKDPSEEEKQVLEKIKYQANNVILHTDRELMPRYKKSWASWNYKIEDSKDRENKLASVSYNMNILQGIESSKPLIVSLNQKDSISPREILGEYSYSHPLFNEDAEIAKKQHSLISGINRTHYCGAYWFNGFHEDGVKSALRVVEELEKQSLNLEDEKRLAYV